MARFFVAQPLVVNAIYGLPPEVVRHVQVLRYRQGQELSLFNGDGYDYLARIEKLERREISVTILSATRVVNESPLAINLLVAVIANDKMDLLIQKAVELGVAKISPLFSERCQRLKSERMTNRVEHWQKIIIAACEQSGRAVVPQLVEPQEFNSAILQAAGVVKWILSPHHLSAEYNLSPEAVTSVDLAVGPEGGFSEEEIKTAHDCGFSSRQLGTRILRAETAVIAGISILQAQLGDFSCVNNPMIFRS